MKITATTMVVALMSCFASAIGATPPAHSAKFQLPEQASDKAAPPSKILEVIPLPPLPPLPPAVVPPIVASFTTAPTTSPGDQQRAEAAIESATTTVRVRIASATMVSIITMTGRRVSLRTTRSVPIGRSGDLETSRWVYHDRFGRTIGGGNLLCRWATEVRRLCWGEIRLPRGKLIMLGSSQTRVLGEFAVIGGTGVYTFKQGLLSFRQLSVRKYAVRVLLA